LTTRIQGNNKAAKLKTNLLLAFDTIASHLLTSFSSLSTALAQIKLPGASSTLTRVYLAILVGPSLGTAKSKVFYGVDKFQAQIWASLDELEVEAKEEDADSGDEYPEESEDESTGEEDELEVGSSSEGEEGNCDGERGLEDSEDPGRAGDHDDVGKDEKKNDAHRFQDPSSTPKWSYAEEKRFLQIADRSLARTLAAADANGCGIANEMCPSWNNFVGWVSCF